MRFLCGGEPFSPLVNGHVKRIPVVPIVISGIVRAYVGSVLDIIRPLDAASLEEQGSPFGGFLSRGYVARYGFHHVAYPKLFSRLDCDWPGIFIKIEERGKFKRCAILKLYVVAYFVHRNAETKIYRIPKFDGFSKEVLVHCPSPFSRWSRS